MPVDKSMLSTSFFEMCRSLRRSLLRVVVNKSKVLKVHQKGAPDIPNDDFSLCLSTNICFRCRCSRFSEIQGVHIHVYLLTKVSFYRYTRGVCQASTMMMFPCACRRICASEVHFQGPNVYFCVAGCTKMLRMVVFC